MRSKNLARAGNDRRWARALALFLLAPFIGEWVLGNQSLTALPQLLLLAPLYGGGALLIREAGRRSRSPWPTMVVLAVAYALVEEGLVDQMIINPGYLGLPGFEGYAQVPGLEVSARLTLDSVALHAIGSTCVPITLVEAFDRRRAEPWLGRAGLTVTTTVFVVGSTALGVLQAHDLHVVGTPLQLGTITAMVVGLVLTAVRVARRERDVSHDGRMPGTRTVGVGAFAVTTAFWLTDLLLGARADGWGAVGLGSLLLAGGAVVLAQVSRRPGWGDRQRLAVACGALSTYLWLAFPNTALLGVPLVLGIVGNVLFGTAAVLLMIRAWRSLEREADQAADPSRAPRPA